MTTSFAVWALTYLVHSTVLIVFAAIITRFTESSALRDVVWKTALLGAIATASLQNLVPKIPSFHIEAPVAAVETEFPVTFQTADDSVAAPANFEEGVTVAEPHDATASITVVDAFAGFWLFVSTILLARLVFARRRLMKVLAPKSPVADAEAVAIIDELSADARVGSVTLTESTLSLSPFATHRREICVPVGFFSDLSAGRKRVLLAHEIAHIARRDPQWLLLSEVVKAIFFFQPLNTIAQRQMRDASEFLCDDFAVARTGMRRELAESLAGLAHAVRGSALPLSAMAEGRSRLVERVARLLSDRKPELTLEPRFRVAIGLSLVTMMFFLAPVVAAVDRAVPKPAAPVAAPTPPVVATRAVEATKPMPEVATVAGAMSVAPVTSEAHVKNGDQAADVAPVAAGVASFADPATRVAALAPLEPASSVNTVVATPGVARPEATSVEPAVPSPAAPRALPTPAPMTSRVAESQGSASNSSAAEAAFVLPADARIVIATFRDCRGRVRLNTAAVGPSRVSYGASSSSITSASYTGSKGTMMSSPTDSSNQPTQNHGSGGSGAYVSDAFPASHCSGAGIRSSNAYREALGNRALLVEVSPTLDHEQRRERLIDVAREQGAQFVLDGEVVTAERGPSGALATLLNVLVRTQLIRIADGQIVETRQDRASGFAQTGGAYKALARRVAAAWKSTGA